MIRKIHITTLLLATGLFTACSDWLEVRPDTEVKDKDLLVDVKGFQDALTGCYMQLSSQSIYGERLTMSNIESLANLWYMASSENRLQADWFLKNHNYTNDNARTAIQSIYGGLYNTIAQTNMIINNINNIGASDMRELILAEAYAIRAFCHLDALRLFGQMPQGGTRTVMLPYSETADIKTLPRYYSYEDFIKKLEDDFGRAEEILRTKDPLFNYTFAQLNTATTVNALDDNYLGYRQFRMNYYAVRGLQARMYLYIGNTTKAYELASSIINAKGVDGQDLMPLSGLEDIAKGYYALPSESLLAISKYNLLSYTTNLLAGNVTEGISINNHLLITTTMLGQLYQGQNTASNNRYLNVWNRNVQTASGVRYPAIRKYSYTAAATDSGDSAMNKSQLIPLLRMSELYLIAMETAPSISEANSLYRIYKQSQNELITNDRFASESELKSELLNEYRREFYAEGQMFYMYKRTASTTMLWRRGTVGEEQYIVPLPDSEFNPNNL